MSATSTEPIDVVYTWVDDSLPGYMETMLSYKDEEVILNPNRTRDNLDILKYSLRSLEKHLPWVRHVYLVTCRPQKPEWLNRNAPGITLVHHDEIMPKSILPTFNSFAILMHLHRIKGLSRRFLYVEDDMLFGQHVHPSDFIAPDGHIWVYGRPWPTPDPSVRHRRDTSPWNTGRARVNHLLNDKFGEKKRRSVNHVPLMIDKTAWREMIDTWPAAFRRTAESRFREHDNVVPEHFYPHYLMETGRGRFLPLGALYARSYYHGIENFYPHSWLGWWSIKLRRPKLVALNDNFGESPNPRVVRGWRLFFEQWLPEPSRFEA